MKISVDGKDIFELSETQKKVIQNDIHCDIFYDDMCRRLHYILTHKYERCFERLKIEWIPKLKENGVAEIPLDDDKLAELIFSQKNYQDRKNRSIKNEEIQPSDYYKPFIV